MNKDPPARILSLLCDEQVETSSAHASAVEHHQKPTPDLPDDFAAFEHALTKVHVRHFHTKDQVAFGIFLRFGSLTSDAQLYHSYGRIRYLTGIPQSSMVRMIHKWRKVGKDITKLDLTIKRSQIGRAHV